MGILNCMIQKDENFRTRCPEKGIGNHTFLKRCLKPTLLAQQPFWGKVSNRGTFFGIHVKEH